MCEKVFLFRFDFRTLLALFVCARPADYTNYKSKLFGDDNMIPVADVFVRATFTLERVRVPEYLLQHQLPIYFHNQIVIRFSEHC